MNAQGDSLMSVRAELVRDQLVGQVHESVAVRYPGQIDEMLSKQLARALERTVGIKRATATPTVTADLATALARLGYLTRIVEVEMFEPAGQSIPWLERELARLDGHGGPDWTEVAKLCAELAGEESAERPDPGPDAPPSWRIPGPGGHVRHYLAVGAAAEHGPKDAQGNPRLPDAIVETGELKRCWAFGFLLRCCEETIESGMAGPTKR